MSFDIFVYLQDSRLPSRDDWQRAIDAKGFDLHLDDFSPRTQTGFLPCKMEGNDCGFEYLFYAIEPDEIEETDPLQVGTRDRVVTFTIHSSKLDCRAATTAAAVLAELADGVFFDPQSGESATANEVFVLLAEMEKSGRQRR